MKNKSEKLKAFTALHCRCEAVQNKHRAYEALFILESARFLLSEMKERQELAHCVGVFDEFFIECEASLHLAPKIALAICRFAREEGIALPFLKEEFAAFPKDVCFVQSRFTEEVLPLLEEDTELYYAESFEEACIMTAEGKRSGCLLPYMGEDRLPLPGIARLIDEYDLKKCRSYLIDNGNQNTLYLLLCGRVAHNNKAAFLELMASATKKQLSDLLVLAEECGLLASLPSPLGGMPTPTGGDETLFCRLTLKGDRENLLLFYGAVQLCLDDSAISGFYDAVELMEE